MFEDSTCAIATSTTNKLTQSTTHMDVKYHHVRSLIADKIVDVKKTGTDFQKADMLTKRLGAVKFLRNSLSLLRE